jgi:REP element-mobilizing transposase RayT
MSYTNLGYHIVFATKERRPFLTGDVMPRLVKYIGGIIRMQEGVLVEANGPEDHIHLVASLTPKFAISDCLRELKANSTNWIHETFASRAGFSWQEGYAAFTISRSGIDEVVRYVRNQQEHHRKSTGREELIRLLQLHGIDYDDKYIN